MNNGGPKTAKFAHEDCVWVCVCGSGWVGCVCSHVCTSFNHAYYICINKVHLQGNAGLLIHTGSLCACVCLCMHLSTSRANDECVCVCVWVGNISALKGSGQVPVNATLHCLNRLRLNPELLILHLTMVTLSICFLPGLCLARYSTTIHLQAELCVSTMHNLVADEHSPLWRIWRIKFLRVCASVFS